MHTLLRLEAIALVAERRSTGIFEVFATTHPVSGANSPARTRLGLVSGRTGHWAAEDTSGKHLSCFNTRADAARMLWNCRPVAAVKVQA